MATSPISLTGPISPLPEIRGLADYWALRTGRARGPDLPEMQSRLLLDMLGLGLEQTITYLGLEWPDYPAFEAWIVETAGLPDPLLLARYNAWLDGAPPPEAMQRQIAAIDAAPPVLDADDLAQWEREGYVIVREAITREEARAAEALLWRQVKGTPDDPESWFNTPRNNGIMVQHFQDPAMEPPRRSPRIHKAFAQLWGTADLWSTVDRMSFNPPVTPGRAFQGPGLHWDVSLVTPIPFATQGILYFTDTAANQGALGIDSSPFLSTVIGAPNRALVLGLNERVDALGVAGSDGDINLAQRRLWQSVLFDSRPLIAAIVGNVDAVERRQLLRELDDFFGRAPAARFIFETR